jgi:arabinogalactan oligomer/maltooligosaccharide transport system substrate-binding protein
MKDMFELTRERLLNLLVLGLVVLALVLNACGEVTPAPARSSPPAASDARTTNPATASGSETPPATQPVGGSAIPGSPTPGQVFTPATRTTPTATTAVIDANLKGSLVIWDGLNNKLAASLKDQAAAFGKAYPGLKVTLLHYTPDELVYAVEMAVKSGKLPDLLVAPGDYVADFNQLKALQPADKVLDKTFLAGFAPNALGSSQLNGSQWGVPYTYSGTTVMLYNKKLVPNPPATWNELGKLAQPLYDNKTKSIGLSVEINEPFFLTALLGGFGGAVLDSRNQPTLDNPQMVSALTYINQLQKEKTVRDDSRLKDNQIEYAFRDGRLGFYIGPDSLIGQYSGAINPAEADAKLDLGIAPLPRIDQTGQPAAPFSNSQTIFLGAQTSGDRLNGAKVFLQWLARPEQQAAILSKTNLLPASTAFLNSAAVTGNPIWKGLYDQLENGKPQPAALEMRAVWAALRPNLEQVVAGVARPAQAAKQMQQDAQAGIARLAVN